MGGNHDHLEHLVQFRNLLALAIFSVALFAIACGSGDSASDSVSTSNDGEEAAPVLRIDEIFKGAKKTSLLILFVWKMKRQI